MNNNNQTTETTTTPSSIGTSIVQPSPITQKQRDFRTWTIDEVYKWALNLDFGVTIADFLKKHDFSGKYLETITHELLVRYNMLGGHAASLLLAINKLKETTQQDLGNITQFWLTLPQANSTHDTLTLLHPLNNFKSIYVRNCYRDFVEIIKDYLKMKEDNEPKMLNFNAGLNISGDAGIGKSTFAPYLIYELQKEKYSFIYHSIHNTRYMKFPLIYYFTYDIQGNPTSSIHTSLRDIPPNDSSQKLKTIYFVDGIKPLLTTEFFTVLTNSPSAKEIYEDFRKGAPGAPNKRTVVRYMPEWSWSEIETYCSINDLNIESIKEIYYIWGGITRCYYDKL
ncbi:hypothetical protein DLAC_04490 [Tieghemostelium lacteum]|uniref:SAM domain-containing protein n=1 Tax=Tieghemostelium lacteum TaxID=361077 RepID=A0A151ZJU6_TIELA|nr:hypothetical protein DLAC_04490 [Tieghemostelium lacteum]|eukprot:KYQ94197.1 hypothetical protein DLAC_04490 [Tieghemostelium lacteum]